MDVAYSLHNIKLYIGYLIFNLEKRLRDSLHKNLILFLNFTISAILGVFYIKTAQLSGFFPYLSLISNTILIYLLITVIFFALSFLPKIIFNIVSVLFFTVLHCFNLIDFIIFNFFKYHINGMVINVITTPGGINALDLPVCNFIYFLIFIILIILIEIFIIYISQKTKFKIKANILILTLFIILASEKGLYIYYDLNCSDEVKKIKLAIPLYQPLTCKKFFKKVLHFKLKKCSKYKLTHKLNIKEELHYPLHPIKTNIEKPPPNIIFILLDAWRADKFNQKYTPNIYEFSKQAIVFKNHKSGGIATRFGVFTLFYGVYGIYWHRFLSEQRSPVFLDVLQSLKYNFKILASSPLTFPEFNQTVFVNLLDKIDNKIKGKYTFERDNDITEKFINWIKKEKTAKQPFFSFIFLDGPHAKSFDPKFNKFKIKGKLNYFIVGKKNITKIKGAYLNAIYYDDYLVGKILNTLSAKGFLKNTIVVISADHGEEFYEHGHLGHTSAFTPEQNNVPLIIYIPGKKHKIYKKLTCHYDIVPTIMKIIGIENNISDFSNGINIIDNKIHKYVIASSWTNFAIIYPDYRFIFSMATYKMGLSEIRDNNFKIIKNNQLIKNHIKDLSKILKNFAKF